MGRRAVRVPGTRGEGEEDGFFLDLRKGAGLEQHGSGDLRLRLDDARQETLGGEEVRKEAEVLLEGLERSERLAQLDSRQERHGVECASAGCRPDADRAYLADR